MFIAPRHSLLTAGFLTLILAGALGAQTRKRSESFEGPLRDPPSRDFDALHLKLKCSFDWESSAVDAEVTHRVRALRDGARTLALDAVGIQVREAALVGGPTLATESLPESLRVDLGKPLHRGEEVEVHLKYRVERPRLGVYFQKPDASYPDRPLQVWTQGEAQEARHWIPCFDHPSDKLTTETIVTVPAGLTSISNGKLVSVEPGPGGAQIHHWLQDKPHTTYLISVVVGDFAVWKDQVDGIELRGFVPRKAEANAARSFALTGDMLRFFGEKTGVTYPWHKYDQICVSGFNFGGMENTSATTLNENTLHDARAALDVSSVGLVAHELAHQWFGDLVTCKDWGDIWLNESFATFFENLYVEHQLGWDEGVEGRREEGEQYFSEDRGSYRRRLSTRSWKSPDVLFDRHTYPKGARILSMLRYTLGDDLFFAGVKAYLEKHAYQPVETHDFRVALETTSGTSLGWFFDEWVLSGGHPEYRVTTEWSDRERSVRVDVEQRQGADDLTPLFRMPVEIAVVQPSGVTEHRVWISERKQSFTFPAAERPRLVRFDPREWILKELDQPRSREELLYQLENDREASGRREAAVLLRGQAQDSLVEESLLRRLEQEPFWAARVEIAASLAQAQSDRALQALVARLPREPKSRVRIEIVKALAATENRDVAGVLTSALAGDGSYFVAAEALRGLSRLLKEGARSHAMQALERDSHDDVLREVAVEILSDPTGQSDEERRVGVERLAAMLRPSATPSLRGAVLRGLARLGRGNEVAFATLTAQLQDSSAFVRGQAAEGLGDLGDRRALSFLEAQAGRERPIVLRGPLRSIREAIRRIEGGATLKDLEAELRQLRDQNRKIEDRLRGLEARGADVKL